MLRLQMWTLWTLPVFGGRDGRCICCCQPCADWTAHAGAAAFGAHTDAPVGAHDASNAVDASLFAPLPPMSSSLLGLSDDEMTEGSTTIEAAVANVVANAAKVAADVVSSVTTTPESSKKMPMQTDDHPLSVSADDTVPVATLRWTQIDCPAIIYQIPQHDARRGVVTLPPPTVWPSCAPARAPPPAAPGRRPGRYRFRA